MEHLSTEPFSIPAAFRRGWELFVEHWTFLIPLQVGTFVVIWFANTLVHGAHGLAGVVAWFLSFALQLIIGMGTLSIMLNLVDGVPQTYKSIFDPFDHFWSYAGAVVLTTLGTGIGLLLLIIPGIVYAVGVCLAQYLIIDKHMKPQAALRESWQRTRGHKGNLALFLLALLGLNILGSLALGVGVLVSIPISGLAYAHVYRFFFPKQTDA
jgi:uncharacterized membrane protein